MFELSSMEEAFGDKTGICIKDICAPVYFRLSRRGDAMEIHVMAKGREGKLSVRQSCDRVIEWVKDNYSWCECLIATVSKWSVYNLCVNLGFHDFGDIEKDGLYARLMVFNYG